MSEEELVTVARYGQLHQAEIAKTRLESEGILTFLLDAHMMSLHLPGALSPGSVKVQVRKADAERAKVILEGCS